ncbi:hypothetical protein HY358_02290 [Candidatus Roizmanbacteria bacterium]|nr:hypothetical protein [Candidatus Roizmanbacteria bacterium]
MNEKVNDAPQEELQKKAFARFMPFFGVFFLMILLGGLMFWVFQVSRLSDRPLPQNQTDEHSLSQRQNNSNSSADWPALWGPPDSSCENKKVVFTASPMDPRDINFIEPIGELKQGHILPGDHIGIDYNTSPTTKPVKVYAPADATLITVERHPYTPPAGYPQTMRHYHFYLVHSCNLFTGFVHLTEFSPEILAKSSQLKELNDATISEPKSIMVGIPIRAGQEIGTAWSFGLLGMVTVDLTATNKGYLKPESYRGENWRMHSVAPFDYFSEPLKTRLLAKNPRTAAPRGGKIDFDIDGKIVGNWFQEGTGGFKDLNVQPRQCGNFPCPYWSGHLALVYDYIDPKQLRVSIGHDAGLGVSTPYGVKGDNPDFKDVDISNGLVKYELVALKDTSREKGYQSEDPLIEVSDETRVLGTMLVQLIESQKLRAEVFPGKMKNQVTAFTSNARVYTR